MYTFKVKSIITIVLLIKGYAITTSETESCVFVTILHSGRCDARMVKNEQS